MDHSTEPSIILPTPERSKRGGVELVPQAIPDEQGRPSQPYRSIDILGSLFKRGAITVEMRLAGEDFRRHFHAAHLDPLMAADVSRPMVSGRTRNAELPWRIEAARESVYNDINAVGGINSLAGSCIWNVIGWEMSLQAWAAQLGLREIKISREGATGILIHALDLLDRHYEKEGK